MSPRTNRPARLAARTVTALVLGASLLPGAVNARLEKPTVAAEEFFRAVRLGDFAEAARWLSSHDLQSVADLNARSGKPVVPEDLLADYFRMTRPSDDPTLRQKAQSGETIVPQRVSFFVPGQYYIVGKYAAVFTRETYYLDPASTGPVRDDPRKLWVDPSNDLSRIRDEAYFKDWWIWDDNQLTMPGMVWLVREGEDWRLDLLSGSVPKLSFRKILRWHFGRDIFDNEEGEDAATAPGSEVSPANAPALQVTPAAP